MGRSGGSNPARYFAWSTFLKVFLRGSVVGSNRIAPKLLDFTRLHRANVEKEMNLHPDATNKSYRTACPAMKLRQPWTGICICSCIDVVVKKQREPANRNGRDTIKLDFAHDSPPKLVA